MNRLRIFLVGVVFVVGSSAFTQAVAVLPDEMLDDPALEVRAREIGQLLRCVVCQNQSIDDSNAPLARDLRLLVRERLTLGDTDEQAIAYIVDRYGNFVLLKPPVQSNTIALWFMPALFVAFALLGFAVYIRQSSRASSAPTALTPEEDAEINALLGSESESEH